MKCYTITDNKVLKGIQGALLPITESLSSDATVMDAIAIPVTRERDGLDFPALFSDNLQNATAVCRIVFTAPDKKTKSDRVLVGYDPRKWYPVKERGDCSTIIYRSASLFVLMTRVNEMVLENIVSDKEARLGERGPTLSSKGRVFAEIPDEEDYFVAYLE